MADFCRQCAIKLFGSDTGDLAKLIPNEGYISSTVICEGCGPIQVNYNGECVSADCFKAGHHIVHVFPEENPSDSQG